MERSSVDQLADANPPVIICSIFLLSLGLLIINTFTVERFVDSERNEELHKTNISCFIIEQKYCIGITIGTTALRRPQVL